MSFLTGVSFRQGRALLDPAQESGKKSGDGVRRSGGTMPSCPYVMMGKAAKGKYLSCMAVIAERHERGARLRPAARGRRGRFSARPAACPDHDEHDAEQAPGTWPERCRVKESVATLLLIFADMTPALAFLRPSCPRHGAGAACLSEKAGRHGFCTMKDGRWFRSRRRAAAVRRLASPVVPCHCGNVAFRRKTQRTGRVSGASFAAAVVTEVGKD